MKRGVALSQKLTQVPVLGLWHFLLLLAKKKAVGDFVIADVTRDQSKFGVRFVEDVRAILQKLDATSCETLLVLKRDVRLIVRADIQNEIEYYSLTRLLLIRVDYSASGLNSQRLLFASLNRFSELAGD